MRYIVIPIEDVSGLFTQEELEHARKSNDGSQLLVHEEVLLGKREKLGLATLPADEGSGLVEWTYPVYESGSEALAGLLGSDGWVTCKETQTKQKRRNYGPTRRKKIQG